MSTILPPSTAEPERFERYRKQMLYPEIGLAGQERLAAARILVVGCVSLGSAIAETMVRAGVGRVRIVDRDYVELSNLQRQTLFDEEDARVPAPKAIAAAEKLRRINHEVVIEPIVADLHPGNVLEMVAGCQLILDGTDNFETRLLVNDVSLELGIPWVHGGCVGTSGQVLTIIPGQTACFRCLVEDAPPAGATESCDTAGILAPAVQVVAARQCLDALKILIGRADAIEPVLTIFDLWDGTHRKLKLQPSQPDRECPACGAGRRDWLRGDRFSQTAVLCGRNSVQITPVQRPQHTLAEFASRLAAHGKVRLTPFLLRLDCETPPHQLTLFSDGRAIVQGTTEPAVAKALYARLIGL